MMRNIMIAATAAVVLLGSCTKSVNITVPPYKSRLVINSLSEAGEPLFIQVGRSISIADKKNYPDQVVRNATVELYENNSLLQTLAYDSMAQGYIATAVTKPGNQYTIKVTATGYETATATATVPQPVGILSYTRTKDARVNPEGALQDELAFSFDDPAAAGDYYILRVTPPADTFSYSFSQYCVNSADASIETVVNENVDVTTCLDNNAIFMRDELFNGTRKQVKLYLNADNLKPFINGADTTYPTIELIHVPEAYFRYEKSRIAADYANGDPFAEPINVYTNVTNGLGIFSTVAKSVVTVK